MKNRLVRALPIVLALALPWCSAAPVNVTVQGIKVGELDISTYADTSVAAQARANIIANFSIANQAAGGAALLNMVAPLGLTYMQTLTFNTPILQETFLDHNGTRLEGTWADVPYLGYTFPAGPAQFTDDNRPWYADIEPAETPGALPLTYPNFGDNQFQDTPRVSWADSNGRPGLANILNGNNGSINFESALVGVCGQPPEGGTPDTAFTGFYTVCVLKTFTWGFNFTYIAGSGGSFGNYTNANYNEALIALAYSNDVSAGFRGAFDKAGVNAGVEWAVALTQADLCPEPGTWMTLSIGVVIVAGRRSRLNKA
jgi:hypothetical protein